MTSRPLVVAAVLLAIDRATCSCSEGMSPLSDSNFDLSEFRSVSTVRNLVYRDTLDTDYSRPYRFSFTIESAPTFSILTTPSDVVVVDVRSFRYSKGNSTGTGGTVTTERGAMEDLQFQDNPQHFPSEAASGMVIQIPPVTAAAAAAPAFSQITVGGSYDIVHIKGDTGLFDGRTATTIIVTGYGAQALIEGVRTNTNSSQSKPWNLRVNCHDCLVQVADSDPLVLDQDGGTVYINPGGHLAQGSKMNPKRGSLVLHGTIDDELNMAETLFPGLSNGCDEPGSSIVLTEVGGCDNVKWHEKDDRVTCQQDENLSPTPLLQMGCTSSRCEHICTYLPTDKLHSCSPSETCQNDIEKDEAQLPDPDKEVLCGSSTSSATTFTGWGMIVMVAVAAYTALFSLFL